METHTYFDGSVTTVPCLKSRFGRCRYCELIDIHGPYYRQDYHRMFRPGDFAGEDAERERAKAAAEVEASGAAVVHPDPTPGVAPSPSPSPSPMLAGDLVAELTSYLGVDRAAKWVARQLTGVPNCGCESRRSALNRADAAARRLLKRLAGRRPA